MDAVQAVASLRLYVAREQAPDILHLLDDIVKILFCSIRTRWLLETFLGLASLVIILETLCCQAVKLNCRVVLGTPTRICVTIAAAIPGTITTATIAIFLPTRIIFY